MAPDDLKNTYDPSDDAAPTIFYCLHCAGETSHPWPKARPEFTIEFDEPIVSFDLVRIENDPKE